MGGKLHIIMKVFHDFSSLTAFNYFKQAILKYFFYLRIYRFQIQSNALLTVLSRNVENYKELNSHISTNK